MSLTNIHEFRDNFYIKIYHSGVIDDGGATQHRLEHKKRFRALAVLSLIFNNTFYLWCSSDKILGQMSIELFSNKT